MAEEAASSEVQLPTDQNPNSVDSTIESSIGVSRPEFTCNSDNNTAESSALKNDDERENSLEYDADELMNRGYAAATEKDYAEATDCYSRALKIRAAHFGDLALECVAAYYKYGCSLPYKAQDEADPLGSMPIKEDQASSENIWLWRRVLLQKQ